MFLCLFWFSFTFYVQVLCLLKYLVIDNKDNESLYQAIKCLDPFPEYLAFKDLRATQQKIKYSKGPYSLLEVITFSSTSHGIVVFVMQTFHRRKIILL